MSWLDMLTQEPAPIDGRLVRRVQTLDPDDSAVKAARKRAKNRERARRYRLRIKEKQA